MTLLARPPTAFERELTDLLSRWYQVYIPYTDSRLSSYFASKGTVTDVSSLPKHSFLISQRYLSATDDEPFHSPEPTHPHPDTRQTDAIPSSPSSDPKYFPPHRNSLIAHITLFHAIPPHRLPLLDREITRICSTQPGYEIFVDTPRKMGKGGVMVQVRERPAGTVDRIQKELRALLSEGVEEDQDRLTEQDLRAMGRPHVTVLNKARDEEEVEVCLREVQEVFDWVARAWTESRAAEGKRGGARAVSPFRHALTCGSVSKGRTLMCGLLLVAGGSTSGDRGKPIKAYWFKGEERHD